MILAVRGRNRELRFGEYAARIPSPISVASGQVVTYEVAIGIAAIGRAIRVVSGMVASMPIRVFAGRRGDKIEHPEVWQARLLEMPVFGASDFDWRWDIVSSLEICENAFLYKRKDRGRIVELEFIPYYAVTASVDRKTGEKKFEVQMAQGRKEVWTTEQVLHVRGQTVGGGAFGVSRITQHRDPLGAIIAAQKFEGRYFGNDARPQTAFIFPQGVTRQQAQEWKSDIEADFGGENYGRPMVAGGGLQITTLPINLQDAQYVEGKQLSIAEAGRIMDVDPLLLGVEGAARGDKQAALSHFLHVQLPPRLRRIERAFHADPDFFGGGTNLYPECEVNELMFADPLTRAQVQHYRVQDGTELVDEARADNGRPALPPIPDDPALEPGKVPQITPVGGAPALPMPATTTEVLPAERSHYRHEDEMFPPVAVSPIALELRMPKQEIDLRQSDIIVNVPDQPQPIVNVYPEVRAPDVEVTNVVEPASVSVAAAKPVVVPAPNVTVQSAEQPAPVVNIENILETPDRKVTFKRGPNGLLTGAEIEDT